MSEVRSNLNASSRNTGAFSARLAALRWLDWKRHKEVESGRVVTAVQKEKKEKITQIHQNRRKVTPVHSLFTKDYSNSPKQKMNLEKQMKGSSWQRSVPKAAKERARGSEVS
jgi:hypothetical protein